MMRFGSNIEIYRVASLILVLLGLFVNDIRAQVPVIVNIMEEDSLELVRINENLGSNNTDADLKKSLSRIQGHGYLGASLDPQSTTDSTLHYQFYLGNKYQWVTVKNGNIDPYIIESSGISLHLYDGKAINLSELALLKNKILTAYENHGYPYATIWLQDLEIENNSIKANLWSEKGSLVKYESIIIDGPVKISSSYISSYLGIKLGDIYSKKSLEKIDDKISQLSFLSLSNNPRVFFNYENARVELPLKKQRASKFDVILGFQPNQNVGGTGVSLTGIFLGDFINQLGAGERFYLGFKRLGPETQELNLALNYPYLLQTPFGIDGTFDLYKRDTSFVNLNAEIGLQFLLSRTNYVKAFWNNKSTNLSEFSPINVQNNTQADIDTRFSNFGIEFFFQTLDQPTSPTRGFYSKFRVGIGTRTFSLNQQVLEANASFYNTIDPSVFQLLSTVDIQYYLPVGKRSTLLMRSRIGWLESESALFRNELFRIGGNQILRGFDDEAFFASRYVVNTTEYRIILGSNRYFFLFADGAYVREEIGESIKTEYPIGLGAGISFQTEAGIFNLTYGLGSRSDESFDFNRSKIHFGYVNLF